MALARRALLMLIAAALALAPVGAAAAVGMTAHAPMTASTAAHHAHAGHHDHGTMHAAAMLEPGKSKPCKHDSGTCSCDDKTACVQTCLAKCFAQMAVLADARTTRPVVTSTFVDEPTERPPDWSATPQPPPPRA